MMVDPSLDPPLPPSSRRTGHPVFSQRTLDVLFIVQVFANVIALAFVIWLVWQTNQDLSDQATVELRESRAVARCTTRESIRALEVMAREIGLRLDLEPPSTAGLDCVTILRVPLDPLP